MKKDFPVTIGGKQYLLRYNFDAIKYVEDITDKPFALIVLQLVQGRMAHIEPMLFAGLKGNHPDVTTEDVSEWLNKEDDPEHPEQSISVADLIESMAEALAPFLEKLKSKKVQAPKKKETPKTASTSKTEN